MLEVPQELQDFRKFLKDRIEAADTKTVKELREKWKVHIGESSTAAKNIDPEIESKIH